MQYFWKKTKREKEGLEKGQEPHCYLKERISKEHTKIRSVTIVKRWDTSQQIVGQRVVERRGKGQREGKGPGRKTERIKQRMSIPI